MDWLDCSTDHLCLVHLGGTFLLLINLFIYELSFHRAVGGNEEIGFAFDPEKSTKLKDKEHCDSY